MNSRSRPHGDATGKPADSGGWRKQKRGGDSSRDRYWQSPTTHHGRDAVFVRRLKLSLLGLLFLGLLSYFSFLIAYWARPVDVATFAVTAYRSPIPPNSLASEDVTRMAETLRQNDNFDCQPPQHPAGRSADFLDAFASGLKSMSRGGPTFFHRTVVIYLSGHGVVNDAGEACLLTSDADAHRSQTWLRMSDVFLKIKNAENLANTNVLLLLDAGRIRECWPLGVFHNGFSRALRNAVTDANDDRIYVINSTSDGQRGWSAPEMSGSPFGYFCTTGMWGAANESGRTVDLQEFHRYLVAHVDGFAREYRNSTQTPELITVGPTDADFPIAYDTEQPTNLPRPLTLANRSEQLSELWQRFANLANEEHAYCFEPHRWAETAQNLGRLEELMIAGQSYDDQFAATVTTTDADMRALRSARTQYAQRSHSVALSRRNGMLVDSEATQQAANAWKDSLTTPNPEEPVAMPSATHPVAASIAWDWLVQSQGSRADLEAGLQLIDPTNVPIEFSEVHLMRMLDQHLDWQYASPFLPEVIAAQNLSERAAAPYDIRCQYWTTSALNEADHYLRVGLDRLFANTPPALVKLIPSYEQALSRQQEITDAFHLRDYTWAVIPHFARWALTAQDLGEKQSAVLQAVDELIPRLHKLSEELVGAAASDDTIENLAPVRERLELLQNAYDIRNRDLYEKGKDDQVALAEIATLLSIPVLPRGSDGELVARYRNELRQRLVDFRWKQPISLTARTAAANEPTNDDEDKAADDNHRLLAYPLHTMTLHPALAMFRRDAFGNEEFRLTGGRGVSASELESVALENGASLRHYLAELKQRGKGLAQLTYDALKADKLPSPLAARRGLGVADDLYRAAASLVVGEPWLYLGDDYSQTLRRLDQHFFWLWHGERATKDLWAAAQPGESFYFSRLGNAYRLAAREQFVEGREYQTELEKLIVRGVDQLNNWNPINCGAVRILGNTDDYNKHRVEFTPLPADFAASYELQDGEVAVAIESRHSGSWEAIPRFDLTGPTSTARSSIHAVSQGDRSRTLEYRLRNEYVSDADFLQATALLRGHRFEVPFGMGRAASLKYDEPDVKLTNITVHGDANAHSQIIFILDCSGSMVERGIFTGAKKALYDVLDVLLREVLQGNTTISVGVYAYGHRASFPSRKSNEVSRIPGAPPNLFPGEDVEQLLPLTLLDVGFNIRRKIDKLSAGGVTPLWYACIRAINELQPHTGDHRRVIVITDGENNQDPYNVSPTKIKSADDVQQASKDHRVKLDLHGYQFAGNSEITDLVKKSAGRISFENATDSAGLAAKILSALKTQYKITRAGSGSALPPGEKSLQETWTASGVSPGRYAVQLYGNINAMSPIELLGGEGLRLWYNDSTRSLYHRRYSTNLRKEVKDVAVPNSQQKCYVGIHMPKKRSVSAVSLQISVQNSNPSKFSQRPRRTWCEIRPVMSDGQVSSETFFCSADHELVPNSPVPLFQYSTLGWPADSFRADLQFWFTFDNTSPKSTNLVIGGQQPPIDNLVPGTRFTVETDLDAFRVVIEESPMGNAPLVPTWVQLSPAAKSIRRTADPASRVVRHVFSYSNSEDLKTKTVKLQAFPRSEIDKWATTGNIRIEVPNQ